MRRPAPYRSWALASVGSELPAEAQTEGFARALDAALITTDESHRAGALDAVAPHLPAELLARALDAVLAITMEPYRARALAALAPHLPPELLPRALEAVQALTTEFSRRPVLAGLAPILARESLASSPTQGRMRREWHRTVRSLGRRRREDLLSALADIEPWSAALIKAETLADIASSVIEVSASVW